MISGPERNHLNFLDPPVIEPNWRWIPADTVASNNDTIIDIPPANLFDFQFKK